MKPTTPEAAAPRLADFLCFAVYSANLAFGRAYRPILDELGLTYPQYIAIVALWEEEDQTVSRLGGKLFLESNTLTPILKKLESTLRANDDETQAPRKFNLEGIGEPSRGHAQQELPNGSRGWRRHGRRAEGGGCGGARRRLA